MILTKINVVPNNNSFFDLLLSFNHPTMRSTYSQTGTCDKINTQYSASQKVLTKHWWDCSLTNLVNRRKLPNCNSLITTFILFTISCTVHSPGIFLPTCFKRQFAKLKVTVIAIKPPYAFTLTSQVAT